MPEAALADDIAVLECADCGTLDPGPRTLCASCHGFDLREVRVPGHGRLVSFTTIRRPPTAFREDGPYVVAIVVLDAGVQVTGRLDPGVGDPTPGMNVRTVGYVRQTPVFAAA